MKKLGQTLDHIVHQFDRLNPVFKKDLNSGDKLAITTQNSQYYIEVIEDSRYQVRGGWFDRQGLSPLETTIHGCTFGSSVIMIDILAACGLCIEFGNRVVTSPIKKIHLFSSQIKN